MCESRPAWLAAVLVLTWSCALLDSGTEVVDEVGGIQRVQFGRVEIWRAAQPSQSSLAAVVSGTFGYDVQCGAYLESDGQRHPAVWAAGTKIIDDSPVTLELRDGTTVVEGEDVTGGGGYHQDVEVFDSDCFPSGETAVFNPGYRGILDWAPLRIVLRVLLIVTAIVTVGWLLRWRLRRRHGRSVTALDPATGADLPHRE